MERQSSKSITKEKESMMPDNNSPSHEAHIPFLRPLRYAGKGRKTQLPRVVIVGGGFAGLNAARKLAGTGTEVLLLDRNNYHGFWPLLYQVATAGIEPEAIGYPLRALFRPHRNIHFVMANVERVHLDKRVVYTDRTKPIPYNYLVLAAGSANNYFGNDALAGQTYALKDIDDAARLRNALLLAFEGAVREPDRERRRDLMTFVIIGGGPTGVELAGAFAELIHHPLRKDYPMLDVSKARVILVEATDKILASFPESLQKAARKKLESMDVELRFNSPVESVEKGCITFKDGTNLQASLVIWTAGVRAAKLADSLGVEQARGSRVKVEADLSIPGHKETFVIGDMAYLEGYRNGEEAYPMVAQPAIQQGKHVANNILASIEERATTPFKYFDPGTMATIGRRHAVMDAFGIRLSGRLAWFGWLFLHIFYLIGFRNRVIVLINWTANYFTFERGVRLITGRGKNG